MDNNVMIKVKTVQWCDGEELEPIELETPGKLGFLNHKYYLIYEESEMTGFPDTTTTIKIWKGNVEVKRKGRVKMTLSYQEGEKQLCMYPTPYGTIGAAIQTSNIQFGFVDRTGYLRVDYTLDADNQNFIENSLRVEVSPLTERIN